MRRHVQGAGLGILTFSAAKIARFSQKFMILALCAVLFEAQAVEPLPHSVSDEEMGQQVQQLDAEILLLKAELARQNGNDRLVKALIDKIPSKRLKAEDRQRLASLQRYCQQKAAVAETDPTHALAPNFTLSFQHPLAILPLSGPYGPLGQSLLKGLQSELGETVQVVDSALFQDPVQLWSLVSLYQPSLILGPLRPDWSLALSQLNTTIPMVTFNAQTISKPHIRSFAPNKRERLLFLNAFLQFQQLKRIGVLYPSAKNAQSYFEIWQALNRESLQPFKIQATQSISRRVDQAFFQLVNADQSQKRARWLQHTLERPLQYQLRARQDLQAIIMMAPRSQGIQGRPLMRYYHLDQASYIWVPDPLPSQEEMVKSLPIWQQTYALFPAYFQLNTQKEAILEVENSTVGIFYAIGEAVVKVLKALQDRNDVSSQIFKTRLGHIWVDKEKQFHLIPKIIWLDEGQAQPFAMSHLWPYLLKPTAAVERKHEGE